MKEIWKPLKNYEGRYEVSNLGNIRSLNYHLTGKIQLLKQQKNKDGYLYVAVPKEYNKRRQILIHRAVAMAFIENPLNKPEVNHKDGNKQNNNSNNLEWVTMQENQRHAWDNGLKEKVRSESSKRGMEEKTLKRLKEYNDVRKKPVIATNLITGEKFLFSSQREAAREINGNQGNIRRVLNGTCKQHKGYSFTYFDDLEV